MAWPQDGYGLVGPDTSMEASERCPVSTPFGNMPPLPTLEAALGNSIVSQPLAPNIQRMLYNIVLEAQAQAAAADKTEHLIAARALRPLGISSSTLSGVRIALLRSGRLPPETRKSTPPTFTELYMNLAPYTSLIS